MILHFYPYPGLSVIAVPTKEDKDLAGRATAADGDLASDTPITNTPVDHGYVAVNVNGLEVVVGDGVKTKDCYFSNDGGTTARAIADIQAGDTLHWVGTVAGYELDTVDRINMNYDV